MSNNQTTHLVLDYRSSQWTGWEWGKTIGGHHSSTEFKLAGKRYRIALLAFDEPASSPNPVYENLPNDSTIAFRHTLEGKFGAYYSFRYHGGLTGRNEFRVQCYSVLRHRQGRDRDLRWPQVRLAAPGGDRMTASQSSVEPRISRRWLLQGAGALGLSAAGSTCLMGAPVLAGVATGIHGDAQPPLLSVNHLVTNYLPSQPTGWPPEQAHIRNKVGVTIGGHVASVPFSFQGTPYEIALLTFGQPGNAPDPVYEPEPSDPIIAFKDTLQKAWGAYYSFVYRGGFSGGSAISVQSYSVVATASTTTQLTYGGDLFLVYEPDPASTDPPITADLRWIEVSYSGRRPSTEFAQRANPYYFPGGLTSVYGHPACSFYGAPEGAIEGRRLSTGKGPTAFSDLLMSESFLVRDTERKDRAGKGIIDIHGGVKWGWCVQAAQP